MAKKKNTWKYIIIGIVVLLVLIIAANKAGWIGKGESIQVAIEKAGKKVVSEMVSASGKIQPEKEVKLSSEVSGEIVELTIKEGDIVQKGQILCRVKPDILQSGYDRAVASLNTQKATLAAAQQQLKVNEATFNNIEATFKRTQELFNKKVISAAEFDQAKADYQAAIANLAVQRQNVLGAKYGVEQSNAMVKEASDNLARTTIYAPVDGVVSLLSVELGERVVGTAQMAGTEIMRIANMSSMEVNVDVNENDINRVSIGNEATIEVDAFQGKKFKGKVTEIASSASGLSETTGTADQVTNFLVKVRILADSYDKLVADTNSLTSPFRPGLSATVDIHTKTEKGLVVPIQSVTTREIPATDQANAETKKDSTGTAVAQKDSTGNSGVEECVFVYKNGKVVLTPVKTSIQDDENIRVLSGLKEGDEVVVSPFTAISKTLKDGDIVEVVPKDKLFN